MTPTPRTPPAGQKSFAIPHPDGYTVIRTQHGHARLEQYDLEHQPVVLELTASQVDELAGALTGVIHHLTT